MAGTNFAGVTGAFGGSGPSYRGYEPKRGNIQRYEKYQMSDIARLQGLGPKGKKPLEGDVFSGPGLGYSPEILQQQAALSEGSRTAGRQRMYDQYAQSPYGTRGREFLSASEGLERGMSEDQGRIAAGIQVANEGQKRSDLYGRLGATGQAYGQGAQLYNQNAQQDYQAAMARFQEKKNRYAAVGAAADSAISMYSAGMF
jgi:hypothetical protein